MLAFVGGASTGGWSSAAAPPLSPLPGRHPSLHAHTVAGVSAASLRRELLAPSLDTGVCGKLSVWLLAMENFLRRFKALIQSSSGTQPCILRWCVGANLRELSFSLLCDMLILNLLILCGVPIVLVSHSTHRLI